MTASKKPSNRLPLQNRSNFQLRDERLKSGRVGKSEKFAEIKQRKNSVFKLEQAYKDREELQNVVPQLEEELKELQDAYDKANRLWFALNDELYERRRRLKDRSRRKEQEVASAKAVCKEQSQNQPLLKPLLKRQRKRRENSVQSYDTSSGNEDNHEEPVLNDLRMRTIRLRLLQTIMQTIMRRARTEDSSAPD